ncbi:MAG: hypothetical protein HDS72_06555 [Bacteroidales bacterium]|nr:hypothetical protein [Bacteroidales bacterium]
MKTKRILLFILPLLMVSAWGCHSNDDEPTAPPELYLLEGDSIALCHISESFNTTSANYPHPWSMADRGSWKGSIELDTIIDPETEEAALTVGALTLYIPEPSNPMTSWLCRLTNVRDFKLYACSGATFVPELLPTGCDSILVDKINPDEDGYINVTYQNWDIAREMDRLNWAFSKVVVHGLDITTINYACYLDAIIDLSGNQLEGCVDASFGRLAHRANLSHNNYTWMMSDWAYWDSDFVNVPDLQYNDIPIPQEILDTDFWRENHERFIGNPGYQAPK